MARLTEADLCFHTGRDADGVRALDRAMTLGRAGGYVTTHTWIPAAKPSRETEALRMTLLS
jgi:hypothetical protein